MSIYARYYICLYIYYICLYTHATIYATIYVSLSYCVNICIHSGYSSIFFF